MAHLTSHTISEASLLNLPARQRGEKELKPRLWSPAQTVESQTVDTDGNEKLDGFTRSSLSSSSTSCDHTTAKNKSARNTKWIKFSRVSEEKLEALLYDDAEEATLFEVDLDRWIRSKEVDMRTLEWAMKLPPSLALCITNPVEPYVIIAANKKFRKMTKHSDPVEKTLSILQGVDSDKVVLSRVFGQEQEIYARLWHYYGDAKPFVNHLWVFPLVQPSASDADELFISHYLCAVRDQKIHDAPKDMINQLRQMISSAGVLGIVSEEEERTRQLMYSGDGPVKSPGKSPPLLKKNLDIQKVEQLRTTALKEGNVQIDWSLRLNDMQSDYEVYENIRRHRLASNKEQAKKIVNSYAHQVTHIQKIESMLRILQPHAPELQDRLNPMQQPLNQRADSAAHRPRRKSVPMLSNRNSLGDDGEREQVCKPDSLAWTSESFARCSSAEDTLGLKFRDKFMSALLSEKIENPVHMFDKKVIAAAGDGCVQAKGKNCGLEVVKTKSPLSRLSKLCPRQSALSLPAPSSMFMDELHPSAHGIASCPVLTRTQSSSITKRPATGKWLGQRTQSRCMRTQSWDRTCTSPEMYLGEIVSPSMAFHAPNEPRMPKLTQESPADFNRVFSA